MEHESIPSIVEDEKEELPEPPDLESQLSEFRSEWQQELKHHKSPVTRKACLNDGLKNEAAVLEQAKILFVKGSQLEQSGHLYEAIEFYRRATQLVPDIEFHVDFNALNSPRERNESESSVGSVENEEDIEDDLVSYLQRMKVVDDTHTKKSCLPEYEQRATHISVLPEEILHYILRWVVSSHLDMKSLENFSQVCRGFYLISRDEGLWRLACLKIWGNCTGKCKKYGGWRNMFIMRPHLHFNGCYISKNSYIRAGEKSLDGFYRPWHLVEYYRYIRLFPDGKMVMVTSSDDPNNVVPKLKSQFYKDSGMLRGIYRQNGNRVIGILKRVKMKDNSVPFYKQQRQADQNTMKQTYHMEFELCNIGKKSFVKLQWIAYSVITVYLATGNESTVNMLENNNKGSYRPLIFSRVKSFTASSDTPLC